MGRPPISPPDWTAARHSVEALAALRPEIAATGHGARMRGEGMRTALDELAQEFWARGAEAGAVCAEGVRCGACGQRRAPDLHPRAVKQNGFLC